MGGTRIANSTDPFVQHDAAPCQARGTAAFLMCGRTLALALAALPDTDGRGGAA